MPYFEGNSLNDKKPQSLIKLLISLGELPKDASNVKVLVCADILPKNANFLICTDNSVLCGTKGAVVYKINKYSYDIISGVSREQPSTTSYGISIHVAGGSNFKLPLPASTSDIDRACEFIIHKISSLQAAASAVSSPVDEIKKLKDLLDSGALTQEEFDQQKARLLESRPSPSITTPKSEAPPQPGKKSHGCLIAALICLAVPVVLLIIGVSTSTQNIPANASSKISSQAQTVEGRTDAKWLEFDNKTWEDFKKIYQAHNSLMESIVAYTAGNANSAELYNYCKDADQYFRKASFHFDYGTTEEEKTYLQAFRNATLCDQLVAQGMCKYLDSKKASDLANVEQYIKDAKSAITLIAENRGVLLVKAGLTEEEIKEKVNAEMEKLAEE